MREKEKTKQNIKKKKKKPEEELENHLKITTQETPQREDNRTSPRYSHLPLPRTHKAEGEECGGPRRGWGELTPCENASHLS